MRRKPAFHQGRPEIILKYDGNDYYVCIHVSVLHYRPQLIGMMLNYAFELLVRTRWRRPPTAGSKNPVSQNFYKYYKFRAPEAHSGFPTKMWNVRYDDSRFQKINRGYLICLCPLTKLTKQCGLPIWSVRIDNNLENCDYTKVTVSTSIHKDVKLMSTFCNSEQHSARPW